MSLYIGRFAPSPSGPLHGGSVIAALGSFLEARRMGGRWLLRIDDIDPPREAAGATQRILCQLEALGFEWDMAVIHQRDRTADYADALTSLQDRGRVYGCTCSRRELARTAGSGPLGRIYPGTCREKYPPDLAGAAVRLRLPARRLELYDLTQGRYTLDAATEMGDPIVRRRDGLWAYHLATTVDDAALGVTDVVRGADLLPGALVQVALQHALSLPAVRWRHLPLAIGADGAKLSKQTGATAIDECRPLQALLTAWRQLGQTPFDQRPGSVTEFHALARTHWRPESVPRGPVPATTG